MNVASYPKSGLHLARTLLRASGVESTHTHGGPDSSDARAQAPDLHVVRDIRDLVVSAVCYFVLERPELDPELIRPHVLELADALRAPWPHAMGASSWSDYVCRMTDRARLTVTYADLVHAPREALAPLATITDGAIAQAEEVRTWRTWEGHVFRRGIPGGWRDVLTQAQADQIVEWHREGHELVQNLKETTRVG